METRNDLEAGVAEFACDWAEPERPLPTTRELGAEFGVSHVTVSKVLKRLAERQLLWRSDSGRYFTSRTAAQSGALKPIGCLLRGFNVWAAWYQHILAGAGEACEISGRGLLFHPTNSLTRQASPISQPVYPDRRKQRKAIEAFLRTHERDCHAILLDDIWSDDVLVELVPRLMHPRIVMRPTRIAEIASFSPDYEQGGMLALSHLISRGFERIWVIRPFKGYVPVDLMVSACERAAQALGWERKFRVWDLANDRSLSTLMDLIGRESSRVGLFCPEDNFGLFIERRLAACGKAVPKKVGILAGLGTEIVTAYGLSSLAFDFEQLGKAAASSDAAPARNTRKTFRFGLNQGIST